MKNKSILVAGLSFVLGAAIAIGGTIAYLTSTDDDVNVLTVGNVKIEQIEQERKDPDNGDWTLVDYTQDKPLLPAVYDGFKYDDQKLDVNGQGYSIFDDGIENVEDKIVTVKNTGKNAAYFRTWIAFENTEDASDFINIIYNGNSASKYDWTWDIPGGVQWINVNGIDYWYLIATYTVPLQPGEISQPSLLQLYLRKEATNAFYDLVGDKYDVLVFTEAVQSEGFADADTALDTAFGDPATGYHPWTNYSLSWANFADTSWYDANATEYTISNAEELAGLAQLVNNGTSFEKKTVTLDADINLAGRYWEPIGNTSKTKFVGEFDGAGYTVKNLTVKDGGEGAGLFGWVFCQGKYTSVVKNVNVVNANISATSYAGAIVGHSYGDITGCSATDVTISVEDKAGAIVGFTPSDSATVVSDNYAENVAITADRDAGIILGTAFAKCVHENNTWSNATVTWSGNGTGANIKNEEVGRS